ncbi:MAG TPA: hypothetical protein VLC91_04500 [Spongiibacteraceae bacterium]|nr:hypothetical protein [Spongiibacteraceae bacterium]
MLRGNLQLPGSDGESATWTTPELLATNGFAVRLVIFFSRLMPSPGVIDSAYVDEVAQPVRSSLPSRCSAIYWAIHERKRCSIKRCRR